jgi:leucyl-tRNA synthetase
MREYDHKALEKKWQDEWERAKLYETPDSVVGKENLYALVEFPYPSGDLHVGHWDAFAVPDMYVRMKRMQGYNVLFPFGYDAFGLPAENAAIKRNINPADWIAESITKMRAQMKTTGNAFDWSREINTSSPEYYRWTQWLFLKLYEKGIAYRGKGLVNWCPNDQTVLANEQVIDGKCERCDAVVEQKELEQWFFKITDYADRLIDDLDGLDWPEPIKLAQKNWIGRSVGAEITFDLAGRDEKITVFTTRPDTLYGATYVVLAPEHPLVHSLGDSPEVKAYCEAAKQKTEIERTAEGKEKTGVQITGVMAINPATKEEVPVYVADYALAHYGTGAVMGVPAHDERDFEFARKYKLLIKNVVANSLEWNDPVMGRMKLADEVPFTGSGTLQNSGNFTRMMSVDAKAKITEFVGGKLTSKYKVRDWLVSRQRYWGAPIPIVYDPEGKAHPIPEEHLPWLLPEDADIKPKGTSPLGSSKELLERTERIFGKGWRPETDTMDGFVDNSWYFFRYLDPHNAEEFSSLEKQKLWMPIRRYSGGAEHTTVHVLYSRFLTKVLFDLGLSTVEEPYEVRLNRGIILAEDGRKMSKRWGNTVNPDEHVANVGADAVRTYLAFIGPYNVVGSFPWSTNGLIGVRRFLERVAGLTEKIGPTADSSDLVTLMQQTIKKVGEDIESMKFNTCVSALMILSNTMGDATSISKSSYETLLVLLAPFAPHLTEELWHELGHTTSIHLEPWPTYDATKLVADTVIVAVQVAGKTRGTVTVPNGASEEMVRAAVQKDEKLAQYIPQTPSRVVYVQNKILNLVP